MIGWLILGTVLAGLLLLALRWWSQATVASAKRSLFWLVILICLLLGTLLFAAGKGILAVLPVGYSVFRFLSEMRGTTQRTGASDTSSNHQRYSPGKKFMTRKEALEILGLPMDASDMDIRSAYKRLMSVNHPDKGGSDWMAAKLNDAKKTLLDD